MTEKFFRSIFLVVVAVFVAMLVLIMGVLYDYFSYIQINHLKTETELCASAVEANGLEYLSSLSNGDYRITWISDDGAVLFDNKAQVEQMENHLEREEITEAITDGKGQSIRYSDTLMERQLYFAQKLSDGTVIRVSSSQIALWSLVLSMLQPILIVMIIAVALSLYLAYRISKRIVQPLNELDLDNPSAENVYEELTPLINRITSQQKLLNAQKDELKQKQEEFNTATNSMNEGIILLNKTGAVLSINQSATKILGISTYCIGKDLLLFNNTFEIQEILRIAETGEHAEKIIQMNGRHYQFSAGPILSDTDVSAIALIIFDITEMERAEEARREFTANVSHELKTPLQVISGSAELLASGMVRNEDVAKFSSKIHTEAMRMITLVEDIIKLSHLDEGAEDMKYQSVDLYALAETTVRDLKPVADASDITIHLTGEKAELWGIPQLLSGILYNLCDNAIKYNREGGTISLDIIQTPQTITLNVSDTGIGIPEDALPRIFERFYRVDKSRSKSVGGTGLGLSIVKHSVLLHNGEIDIQSKIGEGTVITILFPKQSPKSTEILDAVSSQSI